MTSGARDVRWCSCLNHDVRMGGMTVIDNASRPCFTDPDLYRLIALFGIINHRTCRGGGERTPMVFRHIRAKQGGSP